MNQLETIKTPIQDDFITFQQLFDQALKSDIPALNLVLRHLRKSSGKQLRPILTLLCARLFGAVNSQTFNAAISLELLHTASLVHDDVVDESDKRRGIATVNTAFGNKVAVLSGDYLLSSSLLYVSHTDIQSVGIVSRLGQQLAGGELLQLYNTTLSDFNEESYFRVIQQKTASLFEACCMLGAISTQATDEQVEKCRQFGECVGLIFQIRDDIFDYFSNDVGKPTGNDMREGKLTLPAIYVINKVNQEEIRQKALRIRSLSASESEIQEFIEYVKLNGGIEYAQQKMQELHEKASQCLADLPSNEIQHSLHALLDYASCREK